METTAKLIRIVKVKGGDAPQWVREAWLGCEMRYEDGGNVTKPNAVCTPVPKDMQQLEHEALRSVREKPVQLYMVRQDIALNVLRKKLPAAAQWYSLCGHPTPGRYYGFGSDEVEVVI